MHLFQSLKALPRYQSKKYVCNYKLDMFRIGSPWLVMPKKWVTRKKSLGNTAQESVPKFHVKIFTAEMNTFTKTCMCVCMCVFSGRCAEATGRPGFPQQDRHLPQVLPRTPHQERYAMSPRPVYLSVCFLTCLSLRLPLRFNVRRMLPPGMANVRDQLLFFQ